MAVCSIVFGRGRVPCRGRRQEEKPSGTTSWSSAEIFRLRYECFAGRTTTTTASGPVPLPAARRIQGPDPRQPAVGVQLRSGNPDNPISDNQTFDNGFDKKTISISEAYVALAGDELLPITGGKFRAEELWTCGRLRSGTTTWPSRASMQNFDWKLGRRGQEASTSTCGS